MSQRDSLILKQVDLEDRKSACLAELACLAFTRNAEAPGGGLTLKVSNGIPPYTCLADGAPLPCSPSAAPPLGPRLDPATPAAGSRTAAGAAAG